MKTRHDESATIWEMYTEPSSDFDDELDMEEDFEDDFEKTEIIMDMEPIGEVEPIGDSETNEMMKTELKKLAEYGKRLQDICGKTEFDAWMVAKIVKASDYVSDVWHRLDADGVDFANTGFEQATDYQDL
jgi:phosphorylcholine metabolism protein LicD